MWSSANYELAWPRDLFVHELKAIAGKRGDVDKDKVRRLLGEAFVTGQPIWAWDAVPYGREREFVDDLLGHCDEFPEISSSRPYWPRRHGSSSWRPMIGRAVIYRRFRDLIQELRWEGYLDNELTEACPDDEDSTSVDQEGVLAELLGREKLWPLDPENWDDDIFYGLVEVFHDLVARPRTARSCRAEGCVGHYWNYNYATGRALYRWKVNRLLERCGIPLRLAHAGEDVGRLVQVTDDARSELIDRALKTTQPEAAKGVAHGIALFRRRDATEEDKRSAILALTRVLEQRRALLQMSLFNDDEGALFTIANKFDLRHGNDKQHANYDPAFRDWVFWWYLATVELTNRLLDRQRGPASAAASAQ